MNPKLPRTPRFPAVFSPLLPLLALLAVACNDDRTPAPSAGEPIALRRSLAWVDEGLSRVVLLDASSASPKPRFFPLPERVGAPLIPADRSRLLIPVPTEEAVLSISDDGKGTTERWELGAPFDGLALSDDGLALVAYFTPYGGSGVFQNASEVAVLDVTKPQGASNPVRRTVRSFGTAPDAVLISPPVKLGGTERRVAIVRSTSHLALLDMANPASRDVSVPLVTPDSAASIVPDQIEFATGPDVLWAFVRAESSTDVFVLRVTARADYAAASDGPSLDVDLNVFYSGNAPSDLLVLEGGDSPRLLVVNSSSASVSIVDAVTAEVSSIPVGDPYERAVRTVGGDRDLVLLWGRKYTTAILRVLDLDAIEAGEGKVQWPVKVASSVTGVAMLEGRAQAVLAHGGASGWDDPYGAWPAFSGATSLSVLDLVGASATPFTSTGEIRGMVRAPDGPDLLLATVISGEGWLVRLDLDTLHPTPIPIPGTPRQLALLPTAKRLVLNLGGGVGSVLVWDDDEVEEGGASHYAGFLLDGYLDMED